MIPSGQAFQDYFPYKLVADGSTFLDIGSNDPIQYNNTISLERLGWTGTCIDLLDFSKKYKETRKCKFICADVTTCNWDSILTNNIIDYISFDVDDATRSAFDNFPFDRIHCKSITIEHDYYRVGNSLRDYIRQKLISYGYILIFGNVICEGYGAFEDWFINPNYIDSTILQKALSIKNENIPSNEIFNILKLI
jgi:hypothetical protein